MMSGPTSATATDPEPLTDWIVSDARRSPDRTGVTTSIAASSSFAPARAAVTASSPSAFAARSRIAVANPARFTRSPPVLRPQVVQVRPHRLKQPGHRQRHVPRPSRVVVAPDDPYCVPDGTAGGAGRG